MARDPVTWLYALYYNHNTNRHFKVTEMCNQLCPIAFKQLINIFLMRWKKINSPFKRNEYIYVFITLIHSHLYLGLSSTVITQIVPSL